MREIPYEILNSSEEFYNNNYNTKLTPEQEMYFRQWVSSQSTTQSRDVMQDNFTYDLRGFWNAGETVDDTGHGTDRYKKPNHPTFSNESIYADQKNPGGVWASGQENVIYPDINSVARYGRDYPSAVKSQGASAVMPPEILQYFMQMVGK